ncbi:hypothetical protein HDU79_010917 [Rhizoclosmatium sp. JEL0117]|nr:hypothetical protein HDU79_010917 [Rhizoclosmatium sp. JEL0117]
MPKQVHVIRPLQPSEQETIAATLSYAFANSTFTKWITPDPILRKSNMDTYFTDIVTGVSSVPGSFIEVTDDLNAAALWSFKAPESPAVTPRKRPPYRKEVVDIFAGIEQTAPEKPYLYLDFIGAKVEGTGAASALIRHRLANLEQGTKVALWTGTRSNIAFYERFGFKLYSQALKEDLEDGQNGWWMVRDPQSEHIVRPMRVGEEDIVIDILSTAFYRDEWIKWTTPDDNARAKECLVDFTAIVKSSDPNMVIEVTDDLNGAAVWIHRNENVGADDGVCHEYESMDEFRDEVRRILEGIGPAAPPRPYLFLDLIGSKVEGTGAASALIRHRLERIGNDTKVALWTGNKQNRKFYERFGFKPYAQALKEDLPCGQNAWWLVRDASD